jgi:hypothetical protein
VDDTLFPDARFDERLRSGARKILWFGIAVIVLGIGAIVVLLVATRFADGFVASPRVLACDVRLIPDWVRRQPSGIPSQFMAIVIMVVWREISQTMFGVSIWMISSAPACARSASCRQYHPRTDRKTRPH